MDKATIVFFGEDSFSNIVLTSLLKDGHKVPLVVSPLYDNAIHKRLEYTATSNGIEYMREKDINSELVVEKVRRAKPDFLITAHFEKLIKKELINTPSSGCLNLHPSLLPHYRGMSPQHWPIINGEKETGVTVHYIDEGIDTGNIILQRKIELTANMYVLDLQREWILIYQHIVNQAVRLCWRSKSKGERQNSSEGSFYGRLKPEQCALNVGGSVIDAHRLIRGVSMPYHGAYIIMDDGRMLVIWRADIISRKPMTEVGKITTKDDKLYLSFEDGTLLVTKYEIRENTR